MGVQGEKDLFGRLRRAGLKPRKVPRSQAKSAEYADLIAGPFLIEEKEWEQRTMPLAEWWEKIAREASRIGKHPLIHVSTKHGQLVIVDADVIFELLTDL